ncbi:hypothetical protein Thiowin_04106 [Thiorhodovibrio winogradskyi]|uniref:Uncharacterized protein n=1 Tax=Thiorhodovibrio winogradskyi TaxID=77007 RepID=A0ABZ0SFU9_9GAMM|nr:hypothetical protein [Thiorhodovibrio winogradskyi]
MHPSALETGRLFFEIDWRDDFHNILDIGSRDVNGTLRSVKPEGAAGSSARPTCAVAMPRPSASRRYRKTCAISSRRKRCGCCPACQR